MYVAEMEPKCDKIFTGLTAFFTLTTIAAVGVLVWRELFVHRTTIINTTTINVDTNITKDNLIKRFPAIFKMYENRINFQNLVLQGAIFLQPVNQTFDDGKNCSFSCNNYNGTTLKRQKRATTNDVYHACCVSNVNFISPDKMHNILMVQKDLVHLNKFRQVFKNDNCSQAVGCTGCTCMHQMDLVTAVVYKPGFNKNNADSIDQMEIDLFYMPGCCKCVNGQTN
ncbi:uncharacterized protein LOC127718915 [Mytilus californianus]|uniref:uncharacterized protein LOC127718915 n=1 Tax=Mytilus californianus TaxID=6549 RepID=UPI002246D23B|nr:uncharacterized protein LOC127718915 [Mytilus californianus]